MSSQSSKRPERPGKEGAASSQASSRKDAPPREGSQPDARAHDVVLATGVTPDRQGLRVIRARNEGVEWGEVRPLTPGKPLTGDVVRLRPRQDFPLLCDVVTDVSQEELRRVAPGPRSKAGPPQVASQAYRDNWDAIYKHRTAPGSSELN